MADDMTPTSSTNPETAPSAGGPISRPKPQSRFAGFLSLLWALAFVFMIRSSLFEPFKIPSGSMIPTLLIGDHIFVNKFAYRFIVPFSDWFGYGIPIIERDPPKRGDVIVFLYPKDESVHFIKRVVGVAGDTIAVRNKMLYINNEPVKREPVKPEIASKVFESFQDGETGPRYKQGTIELYTEKTGDAEHFVMLDKNNYMGDTFEPVTVPPGHLFVMGDNRDFSNDSRFWGFVPLRNVTGKATVIWLSVSFKEGTFHPDRIGTVLR